ncbi:hypothetical protein [Pseudoflavitalea rhizosphaerae]|uniref:hypothetical protein n=1 Tax=Pseudoflavitalea rhizosphaerae TaxID=1884793 RepID=UPI000F8CA942|nr:hypothetical protein [Pseudoflavitalea rhizosphaerae]
MKKLLFVFAVAAFAACNDSATSEAPKADSSAIQAAPEAAPVDSAAQKVDSTVVADSTQPAAAPAH